MRWGGAAAVDSVIHSHSYPPQGFAFGTGSAIAHRAVGAAVGAMTGGSSSEQPAAAAPAAPAAAAAAPASAPHCDAYQRDFTRCLRENKSDIGSCQMYMDSFDQCQASAARMH